jgi:hypothetical protein
MQTFEELNSFYLKHGLFKERKNVHVHSQTRKINWSKTVTKNEALFSSGDGSEFPSYNVLYANPVSSLVANYEGEISRLFHLVLSLLATFISPIMRIAHPLTRRGPSSGFLEELAGLQRRSAYYRRILAAHIVTESGVRKRVLKVLYEFLKADADAVAKIFGDKVFVFGTRDFEYVWEDACIQVLGARRDSTLLAQPKAFNFGDIRVNTSSQRVDGIIVPDSGEPEKHVIIDAKYYTQDLDDNTLTFPISDIIKQFAYAVSAEATLDPHSILNVLILPSVSDDPGRKISSIQLEHEGTRLARTGLVSVYTIAPKRLFDHYLDREIDQHLRKAILSDQEQFDFEHQIENTPLLSVPADMINRVYFEGEDIIFSRLIDGHKVRISSIDGLHQSVPQGLTIIIAGIEYNSLEESPLLFASADGSLIHWAMQSRLASNDKKQKLFIATQYVELAKRHDIHVLITGKKLAFLFSLSELRSQFKRAGKEKKHDSSYTNLYLNRLGDESHGVFVKNSDTRPYITLVNPNKWTEVEAHAPPLTDIGFDGIAAMTKAMSPRSELTGGVKRESAVPHYRKIIGRH